MRTTLVLLLSLVSVACRDRTPARTAERTTDAQGARYTVVNVTGVLGETVILLDTVTGTSWEWCRDSFGNFGWCPLPLQPMSKYGTFTRETPGPMQVGVDAQRAGRYEILESAAWRGNPGPRFQRRTALLIDHATGKTWQLCWDDNEPRAGWCAIASRSANTYGAFTLPAARAGEQ